MKYAVVGLGPAGAQAVTAIRERDPDGEITVFAEEPFYFRAALPHLRKSEAASVLTVTSY